ncbi:MAG: hypothetical protein A3J74_09715 [Elusimicrobia bacterium RIFCSPHIGHO2_02_FULL_57_9]|nr:MAG: hypothetical protein A3J74_09715 [Elusimicrobia bacterium RIFCSPHIGHO2_02_FULL_57_9]
MPRGGLWLLILGLGACASSSKRNAALNEVAVQAEGWAAFDPKDELGSRRRALAEAQKKAVEQRFGVSVSARTRVDNALTSAQRIMADVRGTVSRYEVLDERREDGLLKIRIKAFMREFSSKEAQAPLPPPVPPPGNHKIAVQIKAEGPQASDWERRAAAALRQTLMDEGFSVVETDAQADFTAQAQARASPVADPRLGSWHAYRARVTLSVIESAGGAVCCEETKEASAVDIDAASASSQAVADASLSAGSSIARELSAWLWTR